MEPGFALTQAFSRLDAFFIEGVGTFRRIRMNARIEGGKIYPPSDRHILESGKSADAQNLELQLRNWLNGNEEEASMLVQKIAAWIKVTLSRTGKFLIPKVGEIVADREGQLRLETSLLGPSMFGMTETELTLPKLAVPLAPPVIVQEKTEAKPERKISMQGAEAKVEKTKSKVVPAKKRSAWPVLLVILFLLLAGGGTLGYLYREEVKKQLTAWGILGGSNDTVVAVDTNANTPPDTSGGKLITGNDSIHNNGNQNGSKVIHGSDGDFAVPPQPGLHYLVIACVKDRTVAETSVSEMRQAGMNVIVLDKVYDAGFYKITLFNSASRAKVIDKMVQMKDKYKDSWIFPQSN